MEDPINLFAPYRQKKPARNGPVVKVQPLPGSTLRITLETGSVVELPLKAYLDEPRFCPLRDEAVWSHADTDGGFVRWYRDGMEVVELAWEELVSMMLGRRWS